MSEDKENGAGTSPAEPNGGGAGIPRGKLAEGVLKMFCGSGYPHVLLVFADEQGAYWCAHTGTYQVYRLHRLAGAAIDEIQGRLDAKATTVVPGAPVDGAQ